MKFLNLLSTFIVFFSCTIIVAEEIETQTKRIDDGEIVTLEQILKNVKNVKSIRIFQGGVMYETGMTHYYGYSYNPNDKKIYENSYELFTDSKSDFLWIVIEAMVTPNKSETTIPLSVVLTFDKVDSKVMKSIFSKTRKGRTKRKISINGKDAYQYGLYSYLKFNGSKTSFDNTDILKLLHKRKLKFAFVQSEVVRKLNEKKETIGFIHKRMLQHLSSVE